MNRPFASMRFLRSALFMTLSLAAAGRASDYQWGVLVPPPPVPAADRRPSPRAYLWVPPTCQRVRAVVFGQHNMLEEDILDDARFREAMTRLDFAIVWVSPSMDHRWDASHCRERFARLMDNLAETSGYAELATVPIVPIGHSAHASFPWNFAAADAPRTLAILSIHGDAPRTPLAGFGPQNATWPDGAIDGIPGLMAMGEYEWSDARLAPATVFKLKNPKAPLAVLAEPGAGHFAAADTLVPFLTMFLEKVAAARLPTVATGNAAPVLTRVDPAAGWLVRRWTPDTSRSIPAGPAKDFEGDPNEAFWAADEEMAAAIQSYRADQVGKKPQLIGYVQDGTPLPMTATHAMYTLRFEPEADGETFKIEPAFLDRVSALGGRRDVPGKNNHVRWTHLAAGTPLGHSDIGSIAVHRLEGPVREVGPNTFRLTFDRGSAFARPAIWFAATHPGDGQYQSAVQQAAMNLTPNTTGAAQVITFGKPDDVAADASPIKLSATSSAGFPVRYFVREGPAVVDGDTLRLLPIPPRARFPIRVTVVAWQWGRGSDPKIQTAAPVEQSFDVTVPTTPPIRQGRS